MSTESGQAQSLNIQSTGYIVTGAVLVAWGLSVLVWKIGRFEQTTA
jgi:hypothetical protein